MLLAVVLASALFLCSSASQGCFTLTGIRNAVYLIDNLQVRCRGEAPVGKAAIENLSEIYEDEKHTTLHEFLFLYFLERHVFKMQLQHQCK